MESCSITTPSYKTTRSRLYSREDVIQSSKEEIHDTYIDGHAFTILTHTTEDNEQAKHVSDVLIKQNVSIVLICYTILNTSCIFEIFFLKLV